MGAGVAAWELVAQCLAFQTCQPRGACHALVAQQCFVLCSAPGVKLAGCGRGLKMCACPALACRDLLRVTSHDLWTGSMSKMPEGADFRQWLEGLQVGRVGGLGAELSAVWSVHCARAGGEEGSTTSRA